MTNNNKNLCLFILLLGLCFSLCLQAQPEGDSNRFKYNLMCIDSVLLSYEDECVDYFGRLKMHVTTLDSVPIYKLNDFQLSSIIDSFIEEEKLALYYNPSVVFYMTIDNYSPDSAINSTRIRFFSGDNVYDNQFFFPSVDCFNNAAWKQMSVFSFTASKHHFIVMDNDTTAWRETFFDTTDKKLPLNRFLIEDWRKDNVLEVDIFLGISTYYYSNKAYYKGTFKRSPLRLDLLASRYPCYYSFRMSLLFYNMDY